MFGDLIREDVSCYNIFVWTPSKVKSHCRILTRENQFWGDWQVLLHLNVCTNICLLSHFSNIDRCQHMLDFPCTDVLLYELSTLLICRLYGYEPLLLVLVANHFNTLFYLSLLLYKRELVVNARWCHTPPFLTSPIQGMQLLLLANIRYQHLCPITSRNNHVSFLIVLSFIPQQTEQPLQLQETLENIISCVEV